jgi:hypothetical protein
MHMVIPSVDSQYPAIQFIGPINQVRKKVLFYTFINERFAVFSALNQVVIQAPEGHIFFLHRLIMNSEATQDQTCWKQVVQIIR